MFLKNIIYDYIIVKLILFYNKKNVNRKCNLH